MRTRGEGGGSKIGKNFADVFYGWPLRRCKVIIENFDKIYDFHGVKTVLNEDT